MKTISVLIVATIVIATSSVALAANPTQADFDACNKMAQSKVSSPSPSASPGSQPRTAAKAQSDPQAAPSDKPASEARVANQADQLRGIDSASKDDVGYQAAYRNCMKGRGF